MKIIANNYIKMLSLKRKIVRHWLSERRKQKLSSLRRKSAKLIKFVYQKYENVSSLNKERHKRKINVLNKDRCSTLHSSSLGNLKLDNHWLSVRAPALLWIINKTLVPAAFNRGTKWNRSFSVYTQTILFFYLLLL